MPTPARRPTSTDVTTAIEETATLVDVVSLDQENKPKAAAALSELAAAGQGQVIESTGDALAEAFAAEAEVLAEQILVTAPLPAGFDAEEATVTITLPTADGELVASAFAKIQDAPGDMSGSSAEPINPDDGLQLPDWALYAGILVFGFGLVTAAMLLVPAKAQPMTLADRVTAYTASVGPAKPDAAPASDPRFDHAKAAAEGVLDRNKGLEEKLARRLAAAGSSLKPSEWLLLHVGIVLVSGLVGLVCGRWQHRHRRPVPRRRVLPPPDLVVVQGRSTAQGLQRCVARHASADVRLALRGSVTCPVRGHDHAGRTGADRG